VLRYTVSFTLTKPVYAESIKASYQCNMIVTVDPGDGQFREPQSEQVELAHINWTIWRGKVLEAGKEHTFEFNGELPPQTPRSWKTPSGRIEHTMTVRLDGVTDSGRLRRTRKTIEVWNPFSMDADNPRPGLEFHGELDEEMVGTSIEIDKDFEAFVRYPDQCYKGWNFKSITKFFQGLVGRFHAKYLSQRPRSRKLIRLRTSMSTFCKQFGS